MTPIDILRANPVVAILRGVRPNEVLDVAQVLVDAGFKVIEVPLNSPEPLKSLERVASKFGPDVLVGAGTVLTAARADDCARAGARLILSPNMNTAVIRRSVELGLVSMPGVATVSEAFNALDAGAHALKMFPADVLGTASLKAWRAVVPHGTAFYAVGGMDARNIRDFRMAGAAGVGLGSSLYVPGMALDELARRARLLLAAWAVD